MTNVVRLETRPLQPRGFAMRVYKLGPNHEIVECENSDEWAEQFERSDARRVGLTDVAGYHVSTVFLGIDHGWNKGRPVLFETMTFGPDGGEYNVARYCTWADAEQGHRVTVAAIKRDRWRRPHAYVWRLMRRAYTAAVLHVSRLRWLMDARRAPRR